MPFTIFQFLDHGYWGFLLMMTHGEKARSAGLFCPTISRLLTRMGSRGTGDSQSP
jgi:hypothetical protein